MFTEDQLLPISALQHLIFCERQCALIHVERLWAENQFTAEGNHIHQKAHGETDKVAGVAYLENDIRVVRGLHLRSLALGIVGQADVVEFAGEQVVPVEYKRGKPKKDNSDRVQLCAQAICLEEMFATHIPTGYLFYGKRKRRTEVAIDLQLRETTRQAIKKLRQMIVKRETPVAVREPKCDSCSLERLCLPNTQRLKQGATSYLQRTIDAVISGDGPKSDDFEQEAP